VGVIDIAGGGVVHCVGGVVALAACALLGPRQNQSAACSGLGSQKNHISVSLLVQAGFALWAGHVMLGSVAASQFAPANALGAHKVCTDHLSSRCSVEAS
jgi:ammonia channel protein AmtB